MIQTKEINQEKIKIQKRHQEKKRQIQMKEK